MEPAPQAKGIALGLTLYIGDLDAVRAAYVRLPCVCIAGACGAGSDAPAFRANVCSNPKLSAADVPPAPKFEFPEVCYLRHNRYFTPAS